MRLAGPLPIGGWIQDPEGYSWGKYPRPASPYCLESPWHCMRQTEQIWFLPLSATLIGAADRAAYEHGHLLEAKAICDWGVIKPVGRGSPPSTSCTSTHGPRWYLGCPDCIWPRPYLRAVLATSKPEIWQCLSRTGWLTACDKNTFPKLVIPWTAGAVISLGMSCHPVGPGRGWRNLTPKMLISLKTRPWEIMHYKFTFLLRRVQSTSGCHHLKGR